MLTARKQWQYKMSYTIKTAKNFWEDKNDAEKDMVITLRPEKSHWIVWKYSLHLTREHSCQCRVICNVNMTASVRIWENDFLRKVQIQSRKGLPDVQRKQFKNRAKCAVTKMHKEVFPKWSTITLWAITINNINIYSNRYMWMQLMPKTPLASVLVFLLNAKDNTFYFI
jgi:hypothetical protein